MAGVVLLVLLAAGSATAQISNWSTGHTYVYKLRPEVRIPVTPLGYRAPGDLPAFHYYSLVALHFLDSDHVLFSFNTTGLMARKGGCQPDGTERMTRVVVVDLATGKVTRQADWQLDDYAQYLWGLPAGQVLLRRCSQLSVMDARLEPHVLINIDGSVELMNQSADRSLLLVEEKKKTAAEAASARASTSVVTGMPQFLHQTELRDLAVNFIRLHPLGVLATSQSQQVVDLPVLSTGFLEALNQPQDMWQVNLQPYRGKLQSVGQIHSTCTPQVVALTGNTFLAIVCKGDDQTQQMFEAYDLQGSLLWRQPVDANRDAPQFAYAENLSRFAVATLHTTHQMAALDPLNSDDVDGQIVDVYEAKTGKLLLSFRTTPVYTAGQNFALSPTGDRLAVLHDDAIEIYNLKELPKGPPPSLR
ncbi:MAG TPA: hypothetical protein VHX63_07665 [Acidobacteriaceae bacterium]|jgi:hypothetical protein|nr:hypothetical protein [Acidobacteriaceae bacterium]